MVDAVLFDKPFRAKPMNTRVPTVVFRAQANHGRVVTFAAEPANVMYFAGRLPPSKVEAQNATKFSDTVVML